MTVQPSDTVGGLFDRSAPKVLPDEHHYVTVDLGARCSIVGRRLQQIDFKDLPPLVELSLRFDGNLLLTLRNDAVQDVSSFEVTSPEPAA